MKKSKQEYTYLKEPFKEWFLSKYNEADYEQQNIDIDQELLKSLSISEGEFYNTYIKPFNHLSYKQVEKVFQTQSKFIREYHLPNPAPFNLDLKLTPSTKLNALQWLLVNIKELDFFSLEEELKELYVEPCKQCHYCGKPNYYKSKNKDEESFNKKRKYCHHEKCLERNSSDPNLHPRCCYGKWALKNKALKQRIKNIDKDIRKSLIGNNKEYTVEYFKKAQQVFFNFCEEQLNHNLSLQYTIQQKLSDDKTFNAIKIDDFFQNGENFLK